MECGDRLRPGSRGLRPDVGRSFGGRRCVVPCRRRHCGPAGAQHHAIHRAGIRRDPAAVFAPRARAGRVVADRIGATLSSANSSGADRVCADRFDAVARRRRRYFPAGWVHVDASAIASGYAARGRAGADILRSDHAGATVRGGEYRVRPIDRDIVDADIVDASGAAAGCAVSRRNGARHAARAAGPTRTKPIGSVRAAGIVRSRRCHALCDTVCRHGDVRRRAVHFDARQSRRRQCAAGHSDRANAAGVIAATASAGNDRGRAATGAIGRLVRRANVGDSHGRGIAVGDTVIDTDIGIGIGTGTDSDSDTDFDFDGIDVNANDNVVHRIGSRGHVRTGSRPDAAGHRHSGAATLRRRKSAE